MPAEVSASRSLCFADYELDLSAYALRRGGRPVKLEKIPMELLILLVQRAGALLPRSEIQARLWGSDLFVDHDAAINTAIRKIRQALDDDPASPRFVETVVGKGYRFVAAVRNRTPPRDAYEPGVEATTPPSRRSRPVFPRYSLTRGNQEFVVEAGESLLGRHPAAEVYVEHPSVSRRHAALTIDGGGAVLRDLGSRNGTFVNGRSIDVPTKLDHGAIIGLGSITLTFVVLAVPPSTKSVTAGRAAD